MSYVTAEYLRSILDYDPETGVFTWLPRSRGHFAMQRACSTWNARYPGTVAGKIDSYGHRQISIDNRLYLAHRLAWLIVTGELPEDQIDHKNCIKCDNRFANLRQATHAENSRNKGLTRNNTSGAKGVMWDKFASKWKVQIVAYGKRHYLGHFDEDKLDEAVAAYAKAARKHHGEFARVA